VNSFDIDGVIYMGPGRTGVWPGPNDIIVTGRSFEEEAETLAMLQSRGINNKVHFNPLTYEEKTRESSGQHKANVINKLGIDIHFEDDPIQADVIRQQCPNIVIVMLEHDLVNKENQRHKEF
jgi:hypothetical protein